MTKIELAISQHAKVLPSQLRQLSDNKYFIDAYGEISPLTDNGFTVVFSQLLVGNVAVVEIN